MPTWPINGWTMGDRVPITVTASPFTYTNSTLFPMQVLVSVGTVTLIEFTRDGVTFDSAGVIAGVFRLNPGDRLRVTYAVAPTMIAYPI